MVVIQCGTVQFQNIQALIFDKDGTLANAQTYLRNLGQKRARLIDAQIPGVQEPLLMAFGLSGDQMNLAGLLAVGTRQENEIAAAAYVAETGRDWMEALTIVHFAFEEADRGFKRKADHTPLFEDGLKLLQILSTAGLKLGLLSSDTSNHVQDFVLRYELASYFQVQMGTDGGVSKPNPLLLQQACQTLEVSVESVLVVGDSAIDIELSRAAKAAGCIAVTWGGVPSAALSSADVVIDRYEHLQVIP